MRAKPFIEQKMLLAATIQEKNPLKKIHLEPIYVNYKLNRNNSSFRYKYLRNRISNNTYI